MIVVTWPVVAYTDDKLVISCDVDVCVEYIDDRFVINCEFDVCVKYIVDRFDMFVNKLDAVVMVL